MNFIGYKNVSLNDGFLYEKQLLNKNVTVNAVYDRFFETGRIDAFKCNWHEGADRKPHIYWDSDVAKWIEGAAYILGKEENEALSEKTEALIDEIEKNQDDNGYFNIYYTVCEPEKRFTDWNCHELYCAGHLFEAAVAYYEATGKDRFLKLVEKYADYIKKVFIDEKTASFTVPGHEEIELALIRMYRATKKSKFLDMASFFINKRGEGCDEKSPYYDNNKHNQSHLPVRRQKTAEGHCVRACYLYSAMADLAYETNDKELFDTCKVLFNDIVNGKMYITGGIGSTRIGEAFTVPYDLKNDKAYNETCAAISLMFFAQRMLRHENDAKYAEIIEKTLYNGIISGLSLDGSSFFYENPLEIDLKNYVRFYNKNNGETYAPTHRLKVFDCSCCPPNLNRVLSSLGDYIYGYEDKTLFVNQFVGSQASLGEMKIIQKSNFPNSGSIEIYTENIEKLCVRIPKWSNSIKINRNYTVENGYAVIENMFDGCITIEFEMTPFLVEGNPRIFENNGKVAVCYGPYVFAAEGTDNVENLHSIFIDKSLTYEICHSDELNCVTLKIKAFKRAESEELYSRRNESFEDFTLTMIPYHCFANRKATNMCVWLNII